MNEPECPFKIGDKIVRYDPNIGEIVKIEDNKRIWIRWNDEVNSYWAEKFDDYRHYKENP